MIQNGICRMVLQVDIKIRALITCIEIKIMTLKERRQLDLSTEYHNNIHIKDSCFHTFFIPRAKNATMDTRSSETKVMNVPNMKTSVGWKPLSFWGTNH